MLDSVIKAVMDAPLLSTRLRPIINSLWKIKTASGVILRNYEASWIVERQGEDCGPVV